MVPPTTHLTPKETLKTLRNINKIIRMRLILHESVPSFANYLIHDGRVTFTVPDEFEIDLSVALSSHFSQFYFVDIRYLFTPSSPIPKGRIRDGLDHRINASLMKHGIVGCFTMLHNLVLTQKVIVCFRQALELSRGHWRGHLRVDLLHRTLIIHYWANRSYPKSWLEIGIRKASPSQSSPSEADMPILHLRWMRNNKEVSTDDIPFNMKTICMESTLRAVISRHISFLLEELYQKFSEKQLYRAGRLRLSLNTSETEPGDCYLDIQLTSTKSIRGTIEPMSGSVTMQSTTHIIGRNEREIVGDKSLSTEIFDYVCRLRCIAAAEEVESHARALGWKLVWPGSLDVENLRRSFPSEETSLIRLFRCAEWKNGWLTAFTTSPDGDNWWIVQVQDEKPSISIPGTVPQNRNVIVQKSRVVTGWAHSSHSQLRYSSFASLAYALAGMVVIQSNATRLAECGFNSLSQPSGSTLGFNLRSRNTFVRSHHINLKSGLPYISDSPTENGHVMHETVRISYRGIDNKTNRGIVIVSGSLKTSLDNKSFASRNINPSWAFQLGKRKFAMRLLSDIGQPVIDRVLSRLQKLFNTVAALRYLQDKNFNPLSISSTRLTFTYPGSDDLKGCLTFHYPQQVDNDQLIPIKSSEPASTSVSFSFNRGNPHNRIRESLTPIFSRSSTSLEFILELLSATLPLLRALDHICTDRNITRGNPYSVQVTSRNPRTYQIFYPFLQYRFHITMKQRKYKAFWLVRNITSPDVKTKEAEFEDTLKNKFFNVNGDGWRGVEGSALADLIKVENFIQLLDDLMKSRIGELSASRNSSDKSAPKPPKKEPPGKNGVEKNLLSETKANAVQKPPQIGSKVDNTQLQGTLDFENSGANIITID